MIPKISIIIVNWNGEKYLEKCLSSVFKQTYNNFEVILVDNGSTDGSLKIVRQKFPQTKIIENNKNLGFAEGNNFGIRVTHGKYIALLNNDAWAEPNWLEELVKVAEQDEWIGSCASKMLRDEDNNIIDSTGIEIFNNGEVRDRGSGEKDTGGYNKLEEVFGACAGAALYRRKMLQEIGVFPCEYFASYEDVDLSFRAIYKGWKCMYVPLAVVHHVRFASQEKILAQDKLFRTQKARNRFYYQMKYLPAKYLLRSSIRLIKLYCWLILTAIKTANFKIIREVIVLLPKVFIARYKFLSENNLNRNEIYKWIGS